MSPIISCPTGWQQGLCIQWGNFQQQQSDVCSHVDILNMPGTALPHVCTWRPWRCLRRQPVSSHAQMYLNNSHSKPDVVQAHQAPCARARLVYPPMRSSHLSRTSGYLTSPLKSVYFHLFLPFGQTIQAGRKKRDTSKETKIPVSLKYCCPHHTEGLLSWGRGQTLGGRYLSWNPVFL